MILTEKIEFKDKIININDLSKGSNKLILVKCDYCDNEKEVSYKEYNRNIKGNGKFSCCQKCGVLKMKENNFKKYGVEYTTQLLETKKKIKDTLLTKYGVEHVSQISKVSKKKKLYKVSEETKNKISQTHKNKTDIELEKSNKKREKTTKDKYDVTNISQLNDIKDKKRLTVFKNFNGFTFQSNELKNKVNKTLLLKYGTTNIMTLDIIKDKIKNTNLKRYGFQAATQNQKIKDKIKNTIIERYGVDNIMFSEDFRKYNFIIGKDPNYVKYLGGRMNEFTCDCGKEHNFEIDTDNYFKRKYRNCPLCTTCYPIDENVSIKEKELLSYIKSIYTKSIIENYRDKYEIDIYLPDLNIGFEFNGIYWHSDKFISKDKHIDKLNFFKDKNIRIIYIWEDDWDFNKDIIKSQINNWLNVSKNKIYARKCQIKEIDDIKLVRTFLNNNHIQGFIHSVKKIGLFYDDELVSIMTFDHFEGRKRIEDWNLSRFCSKLNFNVIGGANKLFNYFIKKYDAKRVITYADKQWSNGNLYLKMGFKLLSESKISYKYVVGGKRINKQNFKKTKLKKLFPEQNLSERQIMINNNINRVYDCGQMKFEFINN